MWLLKLVTTDCSVLCLRVWWEMRWYWIQLCRSSTDTTVSGGQSHKCSLIVLLHNLELDMSQCPFHFKFLSFVSLFLKNFCLNRVNSQGLDLGLFSSFCQSYSHTYYSTTINIHFISREIISYVIPLQTQNETQTIHA